MPVGLRDAEGEKRKQFFFEKKNQKTLLIGARGAAALMPLML
jgi:hypothetical protein